MRLWKRRKGPRQTDADQALQQMVKSPRLGVLDGRPAMPFHCHIGSVRVGAGGSGGTTIDYLAREGDYADRDDLEYLSGDPDAVHEAAMSIEDTARIRRGPRAERILVTQVFELPALSTPAARKAIADAIVERWNGRQFEAVAAVHVPEPKPDGRTNPHIHLAIPARPRIEAWEWSPYDGGRLIWKRDRSVRLMVGKAAVQAERQAIADLINQVMSEHGIDAPEFVPGRLASVGIERKALRRVSQALWKQGQREIDPARRAARHQELKEEAIAADIRRKDQEAAKSRRMAKRGFVSKEWAMNAYDEWQYEKLLHSGTRREKESLERFNQEILSHQRKLLEDLHRKHGRPLPDITSSKGLSDAWRFAREALAAPTPLDQEGSASRNRHLPSQPSVKRRGPGKGLEP